MKKVQLLIKKANQGFSLVEVLLAVSVFGLIVVGLVGALIYGQESTALAGERAQAAMLADEGLEAVRNIRDENFSNVTDGTYGLTISGNQWTLSGSQDTTDIFTRQIIISTVDTKRKSMTANVTWQQNPQRTGTVNLEGRLTDWRRNFANWASPTQQSTINLTGAQNGNEIALYKSGSSTYAVLVRVSSTNPELYVFDVTNPASPFQVGSLDLGATANDVAVCGNYAVVASASTSQELQVVNLTTPSSPSLAGSLDLTGTANGLSVVCNGTTVFLGRTTSTQSEVYAISIANPAAPSILSTLELGVNADATKIVLAQNNQYLYVASSLNSAELDIISVSNPSAISLTGIFDATGVSDGTSITAFSTYAVLGRADGTVLIIDASTPSAPALVNDSINIGNNVQDLAMGVGDIYVFAASNTASTPVRIIDVSNPSSPSILGSVSMSGDTKGIVWNYDLNRAFAAGTSNTAELDVIRPN